MSSASGAQGQTVMQFRNPILKVGLREVGPCSSRRGSQGLSLGCLSVTAPHILPPPLAVVIMINCSASRASIQISHCPRGSSDSQPISQRKKLRLKTNNSESVDRRPSPRSFSTSSRWDQVESHVCVCPLPFALEIWQRLFLPLLLREKKSGGRIDGNPFPPLPAAPTGSSIFQGCTPAGAGRSTAGVGLISALDLARHAGRSVGCSPRFQREQVRGGFGCDLYAEGCRHRK